MNRIIATATIAVGIAFGTVSMAEAAPCRDARGKFIKCPPAPTTPAPGTRCKDAKGKFAKCGTPGATSVAKK